MTAQDQFMRASDAFSWYQEADPAMRATIVALVWLNRSQDWERLAAWVEAATRLVPRLRQRVAEPPAWLAVPGGGPTRTSTCPGTCAAPPPARTTAYWSWPGSRP